MNQDYIQAHPWSIVEEGFDAERVMSSESLFSIGNGAMGQRANFEETYSGDTFQGSYIAGVYYPDKTRVGWWKNGYPEYFAKVLNAPSWIGFHIEIDGEPLDLNTASEILAFRRELNMREGWYRREFQLRSAAGKLIEVQSTRFLSLGLDEVGAIQYIISLPEEEAEISVRSLIDGNITNQDTNWDDQFWAHEDAESSGNRACLLSHTLKTFFHICTFQQTRVWTDGSDWSPVESSAENHRPSTSYKGRLSKGSVLTIEKFGGYTVSRNHPKDELRTRANEVLDLATAKGWQTLLEEQRQSWSDIWGMSDIQIEGDIKAQQGIRFNIFQLNQTYLGTDSRLNIGPKGFTGEKYGGSTYWDTEAYCLPFYIATKNQAVARNLLQYRYEHLEKAIENAEKLGFTGGAALYPMVTMNGEECHNEWEITFEEIHRNGAIAFAIFNYYRYTGDYTYIPEMGLEVLIGISRFWAQRVNYSERREQYVILGVTGPNEYENNVNNNWYTNYLAKWCLEYTLEQLQKVREGYSEDYDRIIGVTRLRDSETDFWQEVAEQMYFPYSEKYQVFLQQDGFLDKELVPASQLDRTQRPLNQKWSWDRILRSPYIKQADVLQGFYFFEDHFSREQLETHFDFYEPLTVHESSLSPCIHSIQAARLGRMDKAYELYLRTSRLDLDDYNKEVEEGLHITSMAGTWLSIVEGFAGLRVLGDKLHLDPKLPEQWESYSFRINFRNRVITTQVSRSNIQFRLEGNEEMSIRLRGERVVLKPEETIEF